MRTCTQSDLAGARGVQCFWISNIYHTTNAQCGGTASQNALWPELDMYPCAPLKEYTSVKY